MEEQWLTYPEAIEFIRKMMNCSEEEAKEIYDEAKYDVPVAFRTVQ